MRIFISAGEASGDAYGAALVREIKRLSGRAGDPLLSVFRHDVGDEEFLQDQGEVDSLDVMEYVMACEDEFGIDIPEGDVPQLKTVGDLRAYLAQKGVHPPLDRPTITFEGVGSARMKAEGVLLHGDSSTWGAVSITQAAKVYGRIWTKFQQIKRILKHGEPGLFIPIDFGFANIRFARYAKACGWKVLYFVPPGSWRRDKQGEDMPTLADEIVTPFEWSAQILKRMGANVHWFGHPIKQLLKERNAEVPAERETVAVLPGSRRHELELNLPLIAEAVSRMTDGRTGGSIEREDGRKTIWDGVKVLHHNLGFQLEFALAPSVDLEQFKAEWKKLAPNRNDIFTVADTYGVLSRARAGIVCSGTATLEAALCRCPMVVVYQISKAMRFEAKLIRFKRPKFIALPNIILDQMVVPELVEEHGVAPEVLRAGLDRILRDEAARVEQLAAFEKIDEILGPDDAITQAAKLALGMIS